MKESDIFRQDHPDQRSAARWLKEMEERKTKKWHPKKIELTDNQRAFRKKYDWN